MYFVAHDLQRPKQIAGASQMQEKHRGAAVARHAFSINLHTVGSQLCDTFVSNDMPEQAHMLCDAFVSNKFKLGKT